MSKLRGQRALEDGVHICRSNQVRLELRRAVHPANRFPDHNVLRTGLFGSVLGRSLQKVAVRIAKAHGTSRFGTDDDRRLEFAGDDLLASTIDEPLRRVTAGGRRFPRDVAEA